MRLFIAFIGLQLFSGAFLQAQPISDAVSVHYDTSTLQARKIPPQKIEAYRADSDFDYGQDVAEGVSIWQRIRYWLIRLWQTLFGESISGTLIEFAFYALCLIGLVYIILRLLDVDPTRLFYRKEKEGSQIFKEGIPDNIHSINFEEEIKKALGEKDYRKAIRLRYLFALKQLTDQEIIRWQPGKTNAEYLQETPVHLRSSLHELNYYYTYTWYGNFPAKENINDRTERIFYELTQAIFTKV